MRDYWLIQQKLDIHVDVLNATLRGSSEVELLPQDRFSRTLRLHCRQCRVKRVTVNGFSAEYEILNFMDSIVAEQYYDHTAFDLFYRGALIASTEGEMIINIPDEVRIEPEGDVKAEEDKDNARVSPSGRQPTFKALRVRVEYELRNPKGACRFLLPDAEHPTRIPHMYACGDNLGASCDGARTWFPSRDTQLDRCPFEIQVTVAAENVAVSSGRLMKKSLDPVTNTRTFHYRVDQPIAANSLMLAVGPFVVYPDAKFPMVTHFCLPGMESSYIYTLTSSTQEEMKHTTANVGHCINYFETSLDVKYPHGCYQQVFVEEPAHVFAWSASAALFDQSILHSPGVMDMEMVSHLCQVRAALGSWLSCMLGLQSTKDAWVLVGLIEHLMNHYVQKFLGKDEHRYRLQMAMDALVAMERLEGEIPPIITAETDVYITMVSYFETLLSIKSFIIMHMIEQKIGKDTMFKGLSHLLKMALGELSAVKDKREGGGQMASGDGEGEEEDGSDPEGDEGGGSSMAPGSGGASGARGRAITSLAFLRTLKRLSGAAGQDLTRSFLGNWIVGTRIAYFTVGFWYNRKQLQAELVMQQETGMKKLFAGTLGIRIVETKGPYDYDKRIDQKRHQFNEKVHEKVRKRRRKRQTRLDEDLVIEGPGMGQNDTPVLWIQIDPQYRWMTHVVVHQPDYNWAEQLVEDRDADSQIQALRALSYFYVPDVERPNLTACVAISNCLRGLENHSRRLRAEAARALAVWQLVHAPPTGAASNQPETWPGLTLLVRCFKEHFYNSKTQLPHPNYFAPLGMVETLKEEDDQDGRVEESDPNGGLTGEETVKKEYYMAEYEIKKAIPRYISLIHAKNGKCPVEIEVFLLELLRHNDNSENFIESAEEVSAPDVDGSFFKFQNIDQKHESLNNAVYEEDGQKKATRKRVLVDDGFYVSTIILSLSLLDVERTSSTEKPKENPLVAEIRRFMHYDSIEPSFNNIVTAVALQALCNMELAGKKAPDTPFHFYLRPRHALSVRRAALESIIRLYFSEGRTDPPAGGIKISDITPNSIKGPQAAILWITDLLASEETPRLRYYAVRCLLDQLNGLPPRTATELLSNSPHAYTREAASYLDKSIWSVRMETPQKAAAAEIERRRQRVPRCEAVYSLREDNDVNRVVVEKLWSTLNGQALALDQRCRVLLLEAYHTVWGEGTPECMISRAKEKTDKWAGGYFPLRQLIEQHRQQLGLMNQPADYASDGGRGPESDDDGDLSRSPAEKRSRSPALNKSILENLKGKKVKFKLGNTQVRAHDL